MMGLETTPSCPIDTSGTNSNSRISFFITIKLVDSFNLIVILLINLRGLEVAELKEEDMPMV